MFITHIVKYSPLFQGLVTFNDLSDEDKEKIWNEMRLRDVVQGTDTHMIKRILKSSKL